MASTSAAQSDKHDPALLGVSIPLSVTVSAAKQVGAAWQKFGVDLVQAVKTAREKPASEEKPAAETSASAAAGVSA